MKRILTTVLLTFFALAGQSFAATTPNVLFIIADDASRHFGQTDGCDWVKTPNIDKLARNGLAFDNAYVVTSKCAPCRAALMTGRNPWQIETGANHQTIFPPDYPAFGEVLRAAGVKTGAAGKTWVPGTAHNKDGTPRDLGVTRVSNRRTPDGSFATFVEKHGQDADAPFFTGTVAATHIAATSWGPVPRLANSRATSTNRRPLVNLSSSAENGMTFMLVAVRLRVSVTLRAEFGWAITCMSTTSRRIVGPAATSNSV